MCMCMCATCIYIYIYIYCIFDRQYPFPGDYLKGFTPCRWPLNSGFDDRKFRWFDGWLIADHLSAIGGSTSCLMRSILAAGADLGPCVGGPWRCQGLGLCPRLAQGRQNGLDCTPARTGAWIYQEPGIQNLFQVGGDLELLGPTSNQTTAWFKELSSQNCLTWDSGRQLFSFWLDRFSAAWWHPLRWAGGFCMHIQCGILPQAGLFCVCIYHGILWMRIYRGILSVGTFCMCIYRSILSLETILHAYLPQYPSPGDCFACVFTGVSFPWGLFCLCIYRGIISLVTILHAYSQTWERI